MKKTPWKTYTFWILLSELTGLLSGLISMNGMKSFEAEVSQPPLSPPGFLFPIVWTLLYVLMGISAARIRLTPFSQNRNKGINIFIAQLILNFFWSPIFFHAQAYGLALFWLILLWITVLWMILEFRKLDKTAALLQIPYLIWLTFAAYLNIGVWVLNN